MPTRGLSADLESGLPPQSGPLSGSAVGFADISWSALRCTLSVAEEAARQLQLCVAWVSEESQKDYDAWNAAKKDDDLFGPLRPAKKEQAARPTSAVAYAAPPGVQPEFSRSQLTNAQEIQQNAKAVRPVVQRTGLTDGGADAILAATSAWEDFRCSPTPLQHHSAADQPLTCSPPGVTAGSHIQRQGHKHDAQDNFSIDLPGECDEVLSAELIVYLSIVM